MQLLVKLLSITDEDQVEPTDTDRPKPYTGSTSEQRASPLTGNMLAVSLVSMLASDRPLKARRIQYALQSFSAVLDLHVGWEIIGHQCIQRVSMPQPQCVNGED